MSSKTLEARLDKLELSLTPVKQLHIIHARPGYIAQLDKETEGEAIARYEAATGRKVRPGDQVMRRVILAATDGRPSTPEECLAGNTSTGHRWNAEGKECV